jgi:hypothetical protein
MNLDPRPCARWRRSRRQSACASRTLERGYKRTPPCPAACCPRRDDVFASSARSARPMDDVLDRGDHGVGRVAEDLCACGALLLIRTRARCSPRRRRRRRAHLLLGGARVGSGADPEHGRARQRRKSGPSSPLTASISITTSADSAGDIRAERPSAARMRMIHPRRRNCLPALARAFSKAGHFAHGCELHVPSECWRVTPGNRRDPRRAGRREKTPQQGGELRAPRT